MIVKELIKLEIRWRSLAAIFNRDFLFLDGQARGLLQAADELKALREKKVKEEYQCD